MARSAAQHNASSTGMERSDDSFFFDDGYREPNSVHITEDWDTMMEEFYDDYEDFGDVDFPAVDDDI
ncbi:MAG: hypothetical protein OEZ58_06895 [Gammaproteobacteria bacterium]|nr:hypothetical protein [Gammaproteobacteria bacterium]MDH5728700.1 hypothetical protein [Gammaproteobacteria bacterium]